MAYNTSEFSSGPSDPRFMEFILRGDDFLNIQLLRQAKSWYIKALELDLGSESVKHKIAECDRLLAYERKVVWILLAIASGLLLVFLLLSM